MLSHSSILAEDALIASVNLSNASLTLSAGVRVCWSCAAQESAGSCEVLLVWLLLS
jgi:hypothetical protein